VDLGYTAADTVGNAGEIAEWARGKGFTRLIVVTSDYHMPRSILEIRAAMPEATLIEYPVVTGLVDVDRWWRNQGDARRLIVEYSKYLAILARESFLALGPRDAAPGAQTKETSS
jgi:uncharacterized SAM-binding protein YcdF (DUF218 family)